MAGDIPTHVPATLQKKLAALASKYRLVAIYAFGSRGVEVAQRVNGHQVEVEHPDSDLDIGVLPAREHQLSLDEKVSLGFALEDIFSMKVDLIVLPEARPFLALDIVRGELLFVSDPDYEAEYQIFVLGPAGDLAYWERERHRILLGQEGT